MVKALLNQGTAEAKQASTDKRCSLKMAESGMAAKGVMPRLSKWGRVSDIWF